MREWRLEEHLNPSPTTLALYGLNKPSLLLNILHTQFPSLHGLSAGFAPEAVITSVIIFYLSVLLLFSGYDFDTPVIVIRFILKCTNMYNIYI